MSPTARRRRYGPVSLPAAGLGGGTTLTILGDDFAADARGMACVFATPDGAVYAAEAAFATPHTATCATPRVRPQHAGTATVNLRHRRRRVHHLRRGRHRRR